MLPLLRSEIYVDSEIAYRAFVLHCFRLFCFIGGRYVGDRCSARTTCHHDDVGRLGTVLVGDGAPKSKFQTSVSWVSQVWASLGEWATSDQTS